jgi:peptidylprolyl isomerase
MTKNTQTAIGIALLIIIIGIGIYFSKAPKPAITNMDTSENKAPETAQGATTTTPSGLVITVLKEGTGPAAKAGDTVSVHYVGTLTDGTKFDSSRDRGTPFTFTLGAQQVIAGWDEGVAGMKVGEERKLVIPSGLAYGPNGIPGAIPGGATLVFDVELLGIK